MKILVFDRKYNIIGSKMRTRQCVQYLVYPKYYSSLAVPYKGDYCIRVRIYQEKQLNAKVTFAYPSLGNIKSHNTNLYGEKTHAPAKVKIQLSDTFFETQTFNLFYTDERISLSSYCIFKLQYDQIREFQTFLEFSLIRKQKRKTGERRDGKQSANSNQQEPSYDSEQIMCTQIFHINNYRRINCFERIYFRNHDFFSCVDAYIGAISLGKVERAQKMQLVEFSQGLNKKEEIQKKNRRYTQNSIYALVSQINGCVDEYAWWKEVYNQTKLLTINPKKSFLFASTDSPETPSLKAFEDLSHLIYRCQDFEHMHPQEALTILHEDRNFITINITQVFQQLAKTISKLSYSKFRPLTEKSQKLRVQLQQKYLLKISWNEKLLEKLHTRKNQSFCFREQQSGSAMLENSLPDRSSFKVQRRFSAKQERNDFVTRRREQFIRNSDIYNRNDLKFPMIIVNRYSSGQASQGSKLIASLPDSKADRKKSSRHPSEDQTMKLVVLVHGFHGTHYDMRKIKVLLEHLSPSFKVLSINSIEKQKSENIEFLGEQVAKEIEFYLQNSQTYYQSISFVGFSLGGVLARSCLIYLKKYRDRMRLLLTLSSPHLGVSECESYLTSLGVWYLSKIDKAQNIKELNFQSVKENDSYLMRLSESEEISWFQKVVLVSSKEDEFVPQYSARIDNYTKNGNLDKMAENIITKIRCLERVDVWFDIQHTATSFNKIIGKETHIEFIENFAFLEVLLRNYQHQL